MRPPPPVGDRLEPRIVDDHGRHGPRRAGAPAAPPGRTLTSRRDLVEGHALPPSLTERRAAAETGRRVLLHEMIASASPSHPIHAARRDLALVLDSDLHVDSPPLPRAPSLQSLRTPPLATASSGSPAVSNPWRRGGEHHGTDNLALFRARQYFGSPVALGAPALSRGPYAVDSALRMRPWSPS